MARVSSKGGGEEQLGDHGQRESSRAMGGPRQGAWWTHVTPDIVPVFPMVMVLYSSSVGQW